MIQVRSESALSFGYKPGGWSHLNEVSGCLALSKVHAVMLFNKEAGCSEETRLVLHIPSSS